MREVVLKDAVTDIYTLESIKEGEVVEPPEFWQDWFKGLGDTMLFKTWAWCIEAYGEFVKEAGRWPLGESDRKRVGELFSAHEVAGEAWDWEELENSFEFQAACRAFGLQQPGIAQDWRKVQALSVATSPATRGTLESRLKKIGVTKELFETWLDDPNFAAELARRSEQNYNKMQFEVNQQIQSLALSGKLDALKYFNELSGRLRPEKAQEVNIRMLLSGIVDILTRNIDDGALLAKLGNELEGFVKRSGVL